MSAFERSDDRAPRRWLYLTIALCALGGFTPLAQALELLHTPSLLRVTLAAQVAISIVWLLVARPLVGRWSLVDSEARALGGLGIVALVMTSLASAALLALVRPPSPYSVWTSWLEVMLSWLPTHAVMAGMISLVSSWTDARRQRERAADREALLQSTVVRAELDALRARVHPHFLLNALNTVAGLAQRGEGARASEVVADLGELLRFSLAESSDDVPFDAEREIVERYLAIEQARLGDRLLVRSDIESAVRTTTLPALTWQPLVENAIRHGIARRAEGGCLTLSARRSAKALELVVDADGPAADAPDQGAAASFGGLGEGLSTISRRLQLLHGEGASVTLVARDGGTRATLLLPIPAP